MNYSVFEKDADIEVKVSGKISSGAVLSSGAFIRSLLERGAASITLNIDGLDDEREMIYHVALINSFKKEVGRMNKIFTLVTTRPSVQAYLSVTGLAGIFPISMHNSLKEVS